MQYNSSLLNLVVLVKVEKIGYQLASINQNNIEVETGDILAISISKDSGKIAFKENGELPSFIYNGAKGDTLPEGGHLKKLNFSPMLRTFFANPLIYNVTVQPKSPGSVEFYFYASEDTKDNEQLIAQRTVSVQVSFYHFLRGSHSWICCHISDDIFWRTYTNNLYRILRSFKHSYTEAF